ncbi:MAG: T9SS type A sorting domain-containing protein, partial [Calditrichaeota bacterium]|nr:T9SS type A sorting domain-containing protein [Calditrichota bacterium]
SGFNLSSACSAQSGKLDPDPATDPNPLVVGQGSKDGTTNKMTNWNCGDNPYYWDFHLEVGDPVIINNNIPLHPQPTNIVLSSFTAEVNQYGILIGWTTETEPDNAGFNIFRSQQENGDYNKINDTMIPAKGNATTGVSYSFLDTPDQAGNYFYKLQSVSLTGDTSFYGLVSVVLTKVDFRKIRVPKEYALHQNYPNPFNPETSIEYALPELARVSLKIYDVNGHLVRSLISGQQSAGTHLVTWDGRDENGAKVVSGVYFYQFKAAGAKQSFSQTNKMILMK